MKHQFLLTAIVALLFCVASSADAARLRPGGSRRRRAREASNKKSKKTAKPENSSGGGKNEKKKGNSPPKREQEDGGGGQEPPLVQDPILEPIPAPEPTQAPEPTPAPEEPMIPAPEPTETLEPTVSLEPTPTPLESTPTIAPTRPTSETDIADSLSLEECADVDTTTGMPPYVDMTNGGCATGPDGFTPLDPMDAAVFDQFKLRFTGTVGFADDDNVTQSFDDDWYVFRTDTNLTFTLAFNSPGFVLAQVFDDTMNPDCPTANATVVGITSSSAEDGGRIDIELNTGRYFILLQAEENGKCIPYDVTVAFSTPSEAPE